MGLPIWRDPEESQKSTTKTDPTAAARSCIRRRASVHGDRDRNRRLRLTRQPTIVPPRFERSPPPIPPPVSVRHSRRNGVPPIATLLESAQRSVPLPPPPPPAPNSRHYYTLEQRERELRDSLEHLHTEAARLRRDAQDFMHSSDEHHSVSLNLRDEDERRALLESATAAQVARPHLNRSRRTRSSARQSIADMDAAINRFYQQRFRNLTPGSNPSSAVRLSHNAAASHREEEESNNPEESSRTILPTPPLDQSEPDGESLFLPETTRTSTRPLHPLSRSWRATSPIDGLGDRNRSPSPEDAWEIMETTIEPDATLPSADSSFSAVRPAESSTNTTIAEPDGLDFPRRRRVYSHSTDDDSDSTSDSDNDNASRLSADLDCNEDEWLAEAESFARDMYRHELGSEDGRARILRLQYTNPVTAGTAQTSSEREVDLGFRLIDEAFDSDEGRERVFHLHGEEAIHRMVRFRFSSNRNRDRDQPARQDRHYSPPTTSQDPPAAHPVSPPSRRSRHGYGAPDPETGTGTDSLLSDLAGSDEHEPDLLGMRRVAGRLAMRDGGDVPDDWWMGLGIGGSLAGRGGGGGGGGYGGGDNGYVQALAQVRLARARDRAGSPDGVRREDVRAAGAAAAGGGRLGDEGADAGGRGGARL